VGASTSTSATQGPMSFPQRHPLSGPGASTTYDYTLGLEVPAAQVSLTGPALSTLLSRDSTNIGFGGIAPGVSRAGNGAAAPRGRTIEIDAEASLPILIEETRRQMTAEKRRLIEERGPVYAEADLTVESRDGDLVGKMTYSDPLVGNASLLLDFEATATR